MASRSGRYRSWVHRLAPVCISTLELHSTRACMRFLLRWFLVVVLLGLVVALTVFLQPLWVQQEATHFGLFLDHVQSNYVMTPEGRVHYYEAEPDIPGGGVPLVLVHGLGDRAEAWAPMIKRLKAAGLHRICWAMAARRSQPVRTTPSPPRSSSSSTSSMPSACRRPTLEAGPWAAGLP